MPYAERGRYLADADIGVSTHVLHVETAFSFRTRMLDYLWAGLPIVCTEGDEFAGIVEREGLGRVVGAGRPGRLGRGVARAAGRSRGTRRPAGQRSVRTAERFRWPRALAPAGRLLRRPLAGAGYPGLRCGPIGPGRPDSAAGSTTGWPAPARDCPDQGHRRLDRAWIIGTAESVVRPVLVPLGSDCPRPRTGCASSRISARTGVRSTTGPDVPAADGARRSTARDAGLRHAGTRIRECTSRRSRPITHPTSCPAAPWCRSASPRDLPRGVTRSRLRRVVRGRLAGHDACARDHRPRRADPVDHHHRHAGLGGRRQLHQQRAGRGVRPLAGPHPAGRGAFPQPAGLRRLAGLHRRGRPAPPRGHHPRHVVVVRPAVPGRSRPAAVLDRSWTAASARANATTPGWSTATGGLAAHLRNADLVLAPSSTMVDLLSANGIDPTGWRWTRTRRRTRSGSRSPATGPSTAPCGSSSPAASTR